MLARYTPLLALVLGACAWIPAAELDAALESIEPRGALGFELLDGPTPSVLSACALPAAPTVRLAFADAMAGRSVTIEVQLDSQSNAVPVDSFDLPDTPSPTLTVAIPVPVDACPDGCTTATLVARALDGYDVLEERIEADLAVQPLTAGLSDVQLADQPPSAADPTDPTAAPASALDVDQWGTLSFTLATSGDEAVPDLAPVVQACAADTCEDLVTTAVPDTPGRFEADLTGLADSCDAVVPALTTLQVRLEAAAFTPEAGCRDLTLETGVPEARFVVRDCDGDEQDATGWGGTDCDDQEALAFFDPAPETLCDGIDNNCNGDVDEVGPFYFDGDDDGWGTYELQGFDCNTLPAVDYSLNDSDCQDNDPNIHPGRPELPCDTLDNDCDVATLDDAQSQTWYGDTDLDGYGDPAESFQTSCPDLLAVPVAATNDDCAPTDASEPREYALDGDGDGFGEPGTGIPTCAGEPAAMGRVPNEDDCDDSDDSVLAAQRWYVDGDGDGLGTPGVGILSCDPVQHYAPTDWDCADVVGLYPTQAASGLILDGGVEADPTAFDWSSATGTLEICPPASGPLPIPSSTLSQDVTIRSGTAGRVPVRSADANTHLFTIDGADVVLDGLSIEGNGLVPGDGGCLRVTNNGELRVENSRLSGCSSTGDGGAIHVDGSTLDVTAESELVANDALNGGAIGGRDCDLTVEDARIADNAASVHGGGVFVDACLMSIVSSEIDDNEALLGGGVGVQSSGGALLSDVLMRRNAAPDGSALTTGSDGASTLLGAPPLALVGVTIETAVPGGESTIFVDDATPAPATDLSYEDLVIALQNDTADVGFEGGSGVGLIGSTGSCSQSAGGCSP
jgi:hypothetical protein